MKREVICSETGSMTTFTEVSSSPHDGGTLYVTEGRALVFVSAGGAVTVEPMPDDYVSPAAKPKGKKK